MLLLRATESDILYFDGDDSIAYQFRVPTVRTAQDLIGFNFKSLQKDGLLMHTEGIQGDYISVELRQARLIVSISLGEDVGAEKQKEGTIDLLLGRWDDIGSRGC